MKSLLITLTLLAGACGHVPVTIDPLETDCGLINDGSAEVLFGPTWVTQKILSRATALALDAATFTTDKRLNDQLGNCATMLGYKVRAHPSAGWSVPFYDYRVSGLTFCPEGFIEIDTPESGRWRDSSLVHELFHVMQGCDAEPYNGIDKGMDANHANWIRTGILKAVNDAQKEPTP